MKKLNLLLVVAILVTSLIAQVLPAKLIRLEVYNWTGENVYIRLEGITTGQFYYLTVPPTTRANWFSPKIYTIITDYYRRTTWACGGVESSGQLRIVKNFRMNFTACGTLPTRHYILPFTGVNGPFLVGKAPNFGEPTMEKVVFFSSVSNKVWVKIPLWPVSSYAFNVACYNANPVIQLNCYNAWVAANNPSNQWNIWLRSGLSFLVPAAGGPLTGDKFSKGVPFSLQDYCSPNNCFYRLGWEPISWVFLGGSWVPSDWSPSGFFYGPGPYNYFRYRY